MLRESLFRSTFFNGRGTAAFRDVAQYERDDLRRCGKVRFALPFSPGATTRRSGMLRSMSAMLCGAAGKSVSLCLFLRARRTAVGHIKDLIGQTAPASMAGIRIKQEILRMATILRRIFLRSAPAVRMAQGRCCRRGVRPDGGLARYTGCVYRCVAGEACARTAA